MKKLFLIITLLLLPLSALADTSERLWVENPAGQTVWEVSIDESQRSPTQVWYIDKPNLVDENYFQHPTALTVLTGPTAGDAQCVFGVGVFKDNRDRLHYYLTFAAGTEAFPVPLELGVPTGIYLPRDHELWPATQYLADQFRDHGWTAWFWTKMDSHPPAPIPGSLLLLGTGLLGLVGLRTRL